MGSSAHATENSKEHWAGPTANSKKHSSVLGTKLCSCNDKLDYSVLSWIRTGLVQLDGTLLSAELGTELGSCNGKLDGTLLGAELGSELGSCNGKLKILLCSKLSSRLGSSDGKSKEHC